MAVAVAVGGSWGVLCDVGQDGVHWVEGVGDFVDLLTVS